MTVLFCRRCVISSMRPRITFDAEGICSACRFAERKATIDWQAREEALQRLCDGYRRKDGSFDVIVPCSGGKDGGFVAHQLKYRYGMNPLCVTWAPLKPTEIGRQNLDAFIASGFDHIMGTPNPKTTRLLTRLAFLHMGDPFQPFIYGQTNFPLQMAARYKVQLIMYGENGEVEYGGDMKNADKPTRSIEDHNGHYFSGKPPEFWAQHGVPLRQLRPFMPPDISYLGGVQIHFLSYYKRWDPQSNYYYCSEHTGFSKNTERSEGTYSMYASLDDKLDAWHYRLAFLKFGIGRATSDAAHEIRDGVLMREEGIALVRKFDDEVPKRYLSEFCEFIGMQDYDVYEAMERWRNPALFDENKTLRYRVWDSLTESSVA